MSKKIKKLSDEDLMLLATQNLVEMTKKFRDGDEKAFENTKYADELAKRGIKLGITRNFINRIFSGEFDNADAVEVSVKQLK